MLLSLGAGKVRGGVRNWSFRLLFGIWESKNMFQFSNNRAFGLNGVGFCFWANLLLLYLRHGQVWGRERN